VSGWLNGVTYGMQIVPSALLPATDRLAGQGKARPGCPGKAAGNVMVFG
jgi:hypothetical protein